ncbi:hypothetical protein N7532_009505 [Penicillium argentinense]|uniref:Arsenite methyltransferase n=1 Tax=Penicillium argentinense TaxID=1131581 RepID=A0A9W9EZK9_9EURO|nr:uncharacterized protein N7532_009505 [Penicillium argentinense]KAJ5090821.1 hypothetical protein N7532_009505 [Penicillium argentinense]
MEPNKIYDLVQAHYGELASKEHTRAEENVAKAFGYKASDLSSIPLDANLGVSCGNPVALANLRKGEIVIDLGSGGGIDVLLAAQKVGPKGKAIGVDMTKSMLELARKNAEKADASNVSFVEASITSVPLPDSTASCIISNCVVNLVPAADKYLAFNEMFRLLTPGGRVAISDILIRKQLPEEIAKDLSLYVGCIAGASYVYEYEEYLHNAGFKGAYHVLIVDTQKDLNIYKGIFQDQPGQKFELTEEEVKELDFNEWAGSFEIYALKP